MKTKDLKDKVIVKNNYSGGCGLSTLLTVLFVYLKLTGQITWSWWWVISPIWIPLVIVLGVSTCIGVVVGLVWLGSKIFS